MTSRSAFPCIVVGIVVCFLTGAGFAQTQAQLEAKYSIKGSTKSSTGSIVMFRLMVPAGYTSTKKYPIVLHLHGAGERGNNNTAQLSWEVAKPWVADSVQTKWAPFALAPQCPLNETWSGANGDAVVKVLDSLKKVYSLDTTRFYVGGLSMGGAGTWYIMHTYPNKFAAAIPCAGMGSNIGATIAKTAFWAWHGDADPSVNVSGSRTAVAAVQAAGFPVVKFNCSKGMSNPINVNTIKPTGISLDSLTRAIANGAKYLYTEIAGGDHSAGCDEGWKCPRMVGWLFSKAKVNGQVVTWPIETAISGGPFAAGYANKGVHLSYVNGALRLHGMASAQITLFSVDGIKILGQSMGSKNELSCSMLPHGIYIAKFKTNDGSMQSARISLVSVK